PITIYALVVSGNYSAFKSTDGGASWSQLPLDASALAIDPFNANTLYAGTYNNGVFRSTDGGATWSEFNNGLTRIRISPLAFDSSGTSLHAGTDVGVFDYQFSRGTNPIDDSQFFVRQQYLDFLGREPDPLAADWVRVLDSCAIGDPSCDRIHVSE